MVVYNEDKRGFNYTDTTRQLFDALEAGLTVKTITCMSGTMRRNTPEEDFTMHNVKGVYYWVGMGWSDDEGHNDLIDIEPIIDSTGKERDMFWMNWVRSFEL